MSTMKSTLDPLLNSRDTVDGGGTYMSKALADAEKMLSGGRTGVPKMVLMMTDGLPSPSDKAMTNTMFATLRQNKYQVMMVLIGGAIVVCKTAMCTYPIHMRIPHVRVHAHMHV